MQPALRSSIPDASLAVFPVNGENSHQGLAGQNPALYPVREVCNSTVQLGLRAASHLNRVRSCCTGKERDAESGNDYFDARYFGSSMGRFLSPDWDDEPSAVPFADFSNPQTLNLYSYSRNNPLRYDDPDGHDVNVCDASGQCHQMSNDQYKAAQQAGNGGLNVPTLDQVGMNGNGSGQFNATNITDANGNTVGTATYVSDGPTDYYANRNGLNLLGTASATVGSVKGVAAFYGASALGGLAAYGAGLTGGGELIITGIESDSSAIEFGKTAEQTAHALRHIIEEGLNPDEVQGAIKADIGQGGNLQAGSNTRYIDVGGKTLRYNAYKLPNGTINVGKIVVER